MNALEMAKELSRKKKYLETLEMLRDMAVEDRRELARQGASKKQITAANARTIKYLDEIIRQRDAIFALKEALGIAHKE